MVVHNTDSVMVEFDVGDRKGEDAIAYSWEVGERAAEECSALFKKPLFDGLKLREEFTCIRFHERWAKVLSSDIGAQALVVAKITFATFDVAG